MEIIEFIKNLESKTISTILFLIVVVFFSGRIIIKSNKMTLELKILICLISFGTIFLIYDRLKSDTEYKRIYTNYSLTKGKILEYFVANMKDYKGNPGNSIKYTYIINNDTLENSYYENIFVEIPDDKPDLKNDFLVIYENGNFKNSFILLNYPIKNSSEFIYYQKQFKDKIPDNVFKN
ncbi:hypothetical protein BXU11_15025 [Flavobacterium sp. LM5]|uniref:hypothetical protein n=1 Tax=Flavobacterium sp. LM5 TaxID=1938610 RepID=UPI000992A747|nr:hypothetical protein [Flavobacterium sp. LM5]OOV25963.1 hypothetical protein BXU11_15025 [Flavobacterium sp. LM5]